MRLSISQVLELMGPLVSDLVPLHVVDYRPQRLARYLWRRSRGRRQGQRIALKTAALRVLAASEGGAR